MNNNQIAEEYVKLAKQVGISPNEIMRLSRLMIKHCEGELRHAAANYADGTKKLANAFAGIRAL